MNKIRLPLNQKKETFPIFYIDAFTNEPFKGNPIAICLSGEKTAKKIMQSLASEINLSETAFVYPLDNKTFNNGNRFSLRWFTPTSEVKLCGHGTLGTASLLFNHFANTNQELFFETESGTLSAKKTADWYWLNFPRYEPENYKAPDKLMKALGIEKFVSVKFSPKGENLLVEIDQDHDLKKIKPDFYKLKNMDVGPIGGVIITQKGKGKYDFVSRYFTPWHGVDEDPVTGSAHSMLAPYWQKKLKKNKMTAFQDSARGGVVKIILDEDLPERVYLGGQTVEILKGEINI